MSVTRDEVLRELLSLYDEPHYLEIGVSKGVTFHRLPFKNKVAVDPVFDFDLEDARRKNPSAKYFQVTSDFYFGQIHTNGDKFDVINIDGLHTAEQTLRDLMSAIFCLKPDGIIVIDDVRPKNHLSALPDRAQFEKVGQFIGSKSQIWMGDVYKVIYFVDTFLQQMSWRTVEENHGQAILWRRPRASVTERRIEAVGLKRFEDLVMEMDVLKITPLESIMEQIRKDLSRK